MSALLNRFRGPLLLLSVLLLANFNIVFLGESLVATANFNPFGAGPQGLNPDLFHGVSPSINWHDQGGPWWQWEPAGKRMSQAFRNGRIPLWDPAVGGGVDSHVNMIQTQYYLPYIALLLAGDTPLQRDYYYLAEAFLSGLFCYLLLISNGCHWLSAVGMGMVYMLSGSMTQNINSSIGQSFAVLPLMVWAVDLVLRRPTWRNTGIAALCLALAASSSFLPAVISGYLLAGIYVFVFLAWRTPSNNSAPARPRFNTARAIKASSAVLLSLLLVSFLLLPVELASRQDETFTHWYSGLGLQHYSLDQMLALVSPSISFDVRQLPSPASQLFAPPPAPSPFYIGLIPILLAALAFSPTYPNTAPRRNRLRAFFAIATAALFLKLVGALPFQWIGLLPIFRNLHFIIYFCGALTFGFAGLAGLGIEALIVHPNRRTLVIGSVALLVLALCVIRFGETQPLNADLQPTALWSAIARYGLEIARLSLLGVAFLAVLFVGVRYRRAARTGVLVLLLIALDLIPLDARQRYLRSDVWASPPAFARFLQADRGMFRVQGDSDLELPADVSQALGLDVLSSRMALNSSRYSEILLKYFDAPHLPYPIARRSVPAAVALLDILDVKYLVLRFPAPAQLQQVAAAGLVPIFDDGHDRVFQNPHVWNRAYLSSAPAIVPNRAQALNALAGLHPGEALLEEAPPPGTVSLGAAGAVDSLRYDFDRITVRVHSTAPALLVLGENSAPGWTATVAGKPAKIYHANYAFQAVAIPAGASDVRFRYTPPGLPAGLAISLIAAAVTLCLCFIRTQHAKFD